MARILRDSSVLNQFGSPSLNSNILSNRPTFGQPGRLFVSTDTLEIYRDTGTAWDNLTNNPGNIGSLQQVTTIGNTTTVGIFAGASGSLTAGRLLEIKGKSLLTDTSGNVLYIGLPSITPNTATLDVYGYTVLRNSVNTTSNLGPLLYAQYELNYAGTQLSGFSNSIFAQDIYNVSVNTTVASSTQSGTSLAVNTYKFASAATITFNPGYLNSIRAASAMTAYSQFQNTAAGTINNAAGITILGIENIGGSALNITNNYQLLINASDEFASTAIITNRWGIYQNGANDVNYFAGNITGNRVEMQVTIASAGYIEGANYKPTGINNFNFLGTDYVTRLATIFNSTGNLRLGNGTTDSTRKLQIQGEAEFITAVATGVHTTSGNFLPIWVNGVQYYLDLLN